MSDRTDQDLLREYAAAGSEAAFSEVVRRYTDLVYSVAIRLVRNPHLAEDVSQRVFLALAQSARQLADRAVLSDWLHCTAHHLSANAIRSEVRRRAREQKAAAMNDLFAADPEPIWESVAPHLDAALSQLSAPDRNAVLLRYFQHKSAREIAQTLAISSEAAQKRVNRAVERLRSLFADRGITIGANQLAVIISANAVQPAPVGLSFTISSAAIAGASVQTSAAIATAKLIAMTTFQKIAVAAALAAIVGTGIYQTREITHLRDQVQTLQRPAPRVPENPPQSAPIATANAAVDVPARPRPAASATRVASAKKKAASPGGFVSTEYYALLTNKVAHLTLAQVEPYLKEKGRSASSLLGAFRTTGDPALLAEAMQKYPSDPQVGFEVATRNDASPQERRAGLDALKQAAPENSLANYLSALDHFTAGQKNAAVEDLNAAAAKPLFNDYAPERTQASEELYRAAGYPAGEAEMIANAFLPEAQLVQVKELGQNLVSLAASYQQAGDPSAHDTALQMALDLSRRFDDPSAGETMRWQLIGDRVERAALSVMDPGSPIPGTTKLVQDRLDQIAQQMQSIQDLGKQADPIWKSLSDEDWTGFHARVAASGEEAAVRWLVSSYGAPNH